MKIKIVIRGQKVHDVGYRFFLINHAMSLGIMKFCANNFTDGEDQAVIANVQGDKAQISAFIEFVRMNKPEKAVVSSVTHCEFEGYIMRLSEFAMVCSCRLLHNVFSPQSKSAVDEFYGMMKIPRKLADEIIEMEMWD